MQKRYRFCRALFTALLFSSLIATAQQERNLSPVTRTFAITNVTVVQAPGKVIEDGTVILRNGLITSVGKNLRIPPDAIILKGDSLYVYAGFIDGFSHAGVHKPKDENQERISDPGNPPPIRVGITPDQQARNLINPADKTIEELRSIGFTVAHVVPHGKMLPGYGAVIQLGGDTESTMLLQHSSSFYSELTPHERWYPNTVIAVLAKWRELYRQAEQAKAYEVMYASNRSGLERPVSDKILEAFYPVIERKVPVMFSAPKFLDVQRVMALQSELGFPLIIGNLKEGWDLSEKLRVTGTKVFLSLELPEEKKDTKADEKKVTPLEASVESVLGSGHPGGPSFTSGTPAPGDKTESELLEARRLEFMQKHVSLSSAFSKAGINYGFSTNTVQSKDIRPNLQRMIKAGLTEDQALAALTINPARMLGLSDRLGTIENGKIANLVVTRKPYFNEKAVVKFVFIDGVLYKTEKEQAKKEAAQVTGNWTISYVGPQGSQEETIAIKKEKETFTASVSGKQFTEAITAESVEIKDNSIKFTYTVNVDGAPVKRTVAAVIENNNLKGTIEIEQSGSYTLEGKKEPKF